MMLHRSHAGTDSVTVLYIMTAALKSRADYTALAEKGMEEEYVTGFKQ